MVSWKRSGVEYLFFGSGFMCLFEICNSSGKWKWLFEKVIMFFCWLMVNFFIFLGNFYRWMIFGFYVNVFFLILRKIFDIDCLDKLL